MEIFDNINKLLAHDLKKSISSGSCLSVAAGCFSIFAFEALKKELSSIVESLFHSGGTSALRNPIRGLDEFELLCFLIIR